METTGEQPFDCGKLTGRRRAICEGTSGLPEWKRQAYLLEWGMRRRGLGDAVADFIKRATFSMVRPCRPCSDRQSKLNRIGWKIWDSISAILR